MRQIFANTRAKPGEVTYLYISKDRNSHYTQTIWVQKVNQS